MKRNVMDNGITCNAVVMDHNGNYNAVVVDNNITCNAVVMDSNITYNAIIMDSNNNGRTIYLDMDGTISNFYQFPGWLDYLHQSQVLPYEGAAPLLDMAELHKLLLELRQLGWKLGIISWLAKGATNEYKKAITRAKKEWLEKWIPLQFDELHFVQYGTRKDYVAKDKQGILFDDSEEVRSKWRGRAINPEEENILEVLRKILEKEL